jgi:LexA-binding, inner membrane-associated putative hydrolase
MSPITHLLASWIIAAKTTDNLRDTRLVTLAGVLPDIDGLGILVDMANGSLARNNPVYFDKYHHWLAHGLPGALVCALILACFAMRRWRVFWLVLLVFHVHLLCDLVGARGPGLKDFWPIFYLGPLSRSPMLMWKYQWALNAWPNRLLTAILLFCALWMGAKRGDTVVGVFNRRLDRIVVGVLQKWRLAMLK